MFSHLCLSIVILFITNVYSERILGIFPTPSISHQVVFRALTNELAKRGHELVIITPDPALPKIRPPDNITEIDISHSYQKFIDVMKGMARRRGVISHPEDYSVKDNRMMAELCDAALSFPAVQAILNDKNQKFDLIISEALFETPIMLTKLYNAPIILFSSLYGVPQMLDMFGAPVRHPILYPSPFRNRFNNMSFWEKLQQIRLEIRLWYMTSTVAEVEEEYLKKRFGNNAPSLQELRDNVDLLFLNVNPIFEGNRPVPPNVIHLGAMQMQPVKPLPEDLQSYLDNSKRGVVYVSLGTNVRFPYMEPALVEEFLDALENIPYDVLFKCDADLRRVPTNVRMEKWFPQRDLLSHPNIKAFVTQGGLQSTDEAIDSGVPLVGLPALGDQWFNTERYEKLGIGIKLELMTLKAEELVEAVKKVIDDKSYKENALKLGALMRDQPETPLQRAVWWTEYVIRNKGAKHLRSPAANITWFEYLMLDVVFVLLAAVLICILLLVVLCRLVLSLAAPEVKVKRN